MKVALINAPRLIFSGDIYSLTSPPLGLAHLYGYLTQKGIDSDLIDFNVELMKNKKIFVCFNNIDSSLSLEDFCLKYKTIVDETVNYLLSKVDLTKYGLLGMSVLENQSLKIIVPLLKKIKSLNPEIKIVLGGSLPIEDKYLLEGLIDFLVLDYGEEALYSIIKSLQKKDDFESIPSIKFVDSGKLISSKTKGSLPFPQQNIRFDKKNIDHYRFLNDSYNNFNDLFSSPILPYLSSRNCSYKCAFCSYGTGDSTVQKKPSQIVQELKDIVKCYSYKYFYFYDTHISLTKKFLEEFCDLLIDSKLDILWSDCMKPMRFMDQNLYNKMREAGCIRLSYGIETGSNCLMKLMMKGHTVDDCQKNLEYAHKAGIWTEAFFFVGFPTETDEDFDETVSFIKKKFRIHRRGAIRKV